MIHFFKFFLRIYNRMFSKDKIFVKRLRSLLGFTPANLGIFKLAFYHKSTTSDKLYAVQSNERLEYLGDAVLATIVAEYLFKKYPNSDEGFLTKMRSKIVKRQSLNTIADKMGLDVFLNQYNNTRLSKSMLGNALEALVGAVYLERGYGGTRRFVIGKILLGYLDIHELESYDDNYKSQLLEWCQKNGKVVSYKMVSKYKFEKRDRFKVAVMIDDKKIADADDFNKKSAEQTASEKAMKILRIITPPVDKEQTSSKPRRNNFSKSKPQNRRDNDFKKDNRKRSDDRKDDKNVRNSRDDKNRSTKDNRAKTERRPESRNNDRSAASTNQNRPEPRSNNQSNTRKEQAQSTPAESRAESKNTNRNPRNRNNQENEGSRPNPPRNKRPDQKVNKPAQQKSKPVENEDWEDIQIPDIKIEAPVAKSGPKPQNRSNNNRPQNRRNNNYKKRPQKKAPDGDVAKENNNPSSKKELTD